MQPLVGQERRNRPGGGSRRAEEMRWGILSLLIFPLLFPVISRWLDVADVVARLRLVCGSRRWGSWTRLFSLGRIVGLA